MGFDHTTDGHPMLNIPSIDRAARTDDVEECQAAICEARYKTQSRKHSEQIGLDCPQREASRFRRLNERFNDTRLPGQQSSI